MLKIPTASNIQEVIVESNTWANIEADKLLSVVLNLLAEQEPQMDKQLTVAMELNADQTQWT